jgi:hypothetical protein
MHFGAETAMYLVFSVFTSRPTSVLASIKVCLFFFVVYILSPSRFTSSADVSHLIPVPPGHVSVTKIKCSLTVYNDSEVY